MITLGHLTRAIVRVSFEEGKTFVRDIVKTCGSKSQQAKQALTALRQAATTEATAAALSPTPTSTRACTRTYVYTIHCEPACETTIVSDEASGPRRVMVVMACAYTIETTARLDLDELRAEHGGRAVTVAWFGEEADAKSATIADYVSDSESDSDTATDSDSEMEMYIGVEVEVENDGGRSTNTANTNTNTNTNSTNTNSTNTTNTTNTTNNTNITNDSASTGPVATLEPTDTTEAPAMVFTFAIVNAGRFDAQYEVYRVPIDIGALWRKLTAYVWSAMGY